VADAELLDKWVVTPLLEDSERDRAQLEKR
jgi:hypothetical protein